MLNEYRFEKFVNVVVSKCKSINDDKKVYYKVNERWVNAVIYQLLYNRAISNGYKITTDSKKYHIYKDCKYYQAGEFEYVIVLLKQ